MQVADLVSSWAQVQAARALADYVGPELNDLDADRHHRLEVRIARKCSDDAAGRDIVAARRLASDAQRVRDAWERGQLNSRHVFIAMERTALAEPELSQAVFEELGESAHKRYLITPRRCHYQDDVPARSQRPGSTLASRASSQRWRFVPLTARRFRSSDRDASH
jgi:hypothetical protein